VREAADDARESALDGCEFTGVVGEAAFDGCAFTGVVGELAFDGCAFTGVVGELALDGCASTGVVGELTFDGCEFTGVVREFADVVEDGERASRGGAESAGRSGDGIRKAVRLGVRSTSWANPLRAAAGEGRSRRGVSPRAVGERGWVGGRLARRSERVRAFPCDRCYALAPTSMARVLITGISGQIGSYAAEMLLQSGHTVLGCSGPDGAAIGGGATLCRAPLSADTVEAVLEEAAGVNAVIHLAGQSSVAASWKDPLATFDANGRLTAALVFAVAARKNVRFVNASSAEIFGNAEAPVQNESTPLAPISPYAVAKAAGHMAVQVARSGLGAPASNLIFYLGESPRRAQSFVFHKITRTLAAIAAAKARGKSAEPAQLVLGNTAVVRDFCHARDLARAAVMLALGSEPGDYVCASGEGHSILDVAHAACELAGVDPKQTIRIDQALFRPNDVVSLVGDASKLRARGWAPEVRFLDLIKEVFEHDLQEMTTG
jgi:GDPmannose 4,6-dehydratase